MDKAKLERIKAKAEALLEQAEKAETAAERALEPMIDSLVMKIYLSDYTGRIVIGGLLLVYYAGTHYGFPSLADLISFGQLR